MRAATGGRVARPILDPTVEARRGLRVILMVVWLILSAREARAQVERNAWARVRSRGAARATNGAASVPSSRS